MPKAAPYVRYVLVRPITINPSEHGPVYVAYSQGTAAALLADLLVKPYDKVSPRYVGLKQVESRFDQTDRPIPYMRLFKVLKPGEQPPAQIAQTGGR
jgi:hypothetical protein